MMRRGLAVLGLFAAACQTPPALRAPVYQPEKIGDDTGPAETAKTPNPWLDCHSSFRTSGDAKADIARLAQGCQNGQKRLTARTGAQSEDAPAQRYTFVAGGPHKCYRVYATGGVGVAELDVLLRGPDGDPVARDDSAGAYAVVPSTAAVCLPQEGVYTLDVSVFRGKGSFVVELWGGE